MSEGFIPGFKRWSQISLFHLEILATTSLAHPHCVRAVDADYDRGYYYLVTELILGGDLERLVAEQGPALRGALWGMQELRS